MTGKCQFWPLQATLSIWLLMQQPIRVLEVCKSLVISEHFKKFSGVLPSLQRLQQ